MSTSSAYALRTVAALALALAPSLATAAPPISASSSAPKPADLTTYMAGYQITEPGISHASVSFVVPTVSCPSSDTQGSSIGIGNEQVFANPTLMGVVILACIGGSPLLNMQALVGGDASTTPVAVGDRITVTVLQKRNKVTVTVTDLTAATKVSISGAPTPDNTLMFGSFPLFSGDMLPVADFGVVQMANPYLENARLQDWGPTLMSRSDGTIIQIAPSAFAASGAFKLKFKNN